MTERPATEPSFDPVAFERAVAEGRIHWSKHCVMRMLQRGISREQVIAALHSGDRLVEYPDDQPFPSALFFGCSDAGALHVVGAFDSSEEVVYVVTVYRPDDVHFHPDLRRRRR